MHAPYTVLITAHENPMPFSQLPAPRKGTCHWSHLPIWVNLYSASVTCGRIIPLGQLVSEGLRIDRRFSLSARYIL